MKLNFRKFDVYLHFITAIIKDENELKYFITEGNNIINKGYAITFHRREVVPCAPFIPAPEPKRVWG